MEKERSERVRVDAYLGGLVEKMSSAIMLHRKKKLTVSNLK